MTNCYTVSVSAPGKVILHGEHSVVYGHTAIATSLGLRSSIVVKEIIPPHEPVILIHLPAVGLQETIPLNPIKENLFKPPLSPGVSGTFSWKLPDLLDHDTHLRRIEQLLHDIKPNFDSLQNNQKNSLRSFLYLFAGIFGSRKLNVKSLDISMGSELTIGAGTGSSASFAVCLAGALIQLLKLKTAKHDISEYFDDVPCEDFTDSEKHIISDWAYNCERIMHGSPSGLDNATCTFGNLISFKKGTKPSPMKLNLRLLRILLVDTRVPRETRSMVVKVAGRRQRNMAAINHLFSACDEIVKTANNVLQNMTSAKVSDIEPYYEHLAELWEMNHFILASLGVSHPALERIRTAANAKGLACKLTGAGGGGYAMILIPPTVPRCTVDSLTGELLLEGFRVTETTLGGPGILLEM